MISYLWKMNELRGAREGRRWACGETMYRWLVGGGNARFLLKVFGRLSQESGLACVYYG